MIEETRFNLMATEGRIVGDDFMVSKILLGDKENLKEQIPSVAFRSMDEEGKAAAAERAEMAVAISENS